jgi:hypothetical protein
MGTSFSLDQRVNIKKNSAICLFYKQTTKIYEVFLDAKRLKKTFLTLTFNFYWLGSKQLISLSYLKTKNIILIQVQWE